MSQLTHIVFLAVLPVALVACSAIEDLRNPTGPEEEKEVTPLPPEEALQALEDLQIPYSQRAFIEHAAKGDLTVVRLFVWAGMDVNVQPYTARGVMVPTRERPTSLNHLESSWFPQDQEDDDTALMKAAGAGHLEVVEFLVKSGADGTIKNQQKQLALTFAAAYGHLDVVQFLVEWPGACFDACEEEVRGLSHEERLEQGIASLDGVHTGPFCRRQCGESGLLSNRLGMSYDPLIHGPATNIQWAAYNGHLDVVAYLHPLLRGKHYQSPHLAFELAVLGGHLDIVNYFIEDRIASTKIRKDRALMQAAYVNHTEIVGRLLEIGASVTWRMSDWIGIDTPEGRLYFEHIGFGPPHAAIQAGSKESLRLLLVHWMKTMGADGRDEYGMTALMFAAAGGDLEISRRLLDNGAPVNGQSDIGMTALMFAAEWGHADIVKILIGEGADASLVSAYGETALILAEEGGHEDVVALLQ